MITFIYLMLLVSSNVYCYKTTHHLQSNGDRIHNKFSIINSKQTKNRIQPSRRLLGGFLVDTIEDYPYLAYLLRVSVIHNKRSEDDEDIESCGATIISPKFAVTSANCFKKCNCDEDIDDSDCDSCQLHDIKDFELFAGSSSTKWTQQNSKLAHVYIHPQYKFVDFNNKCLHRYDVAVLELAFPFRLNEQVATIELPDPVPPCDHTLFYYALTSQLTVLRVHCKIIRWSITRENFVELPYSLEEHLIATNTPLIKDYECKQNMGKSLEKIKTLNMCPDTNICTKSPFNDVGICHGDRGGPVVCGGVQVGVSSWSASGCSDPTLPNVFTRLDVVSEWIQDVMNGVDENVRNRKTYC
uniref:Peptidase S1 domain-containing protein n=1 Tax=Clastoptera arizonana TaxID=38151 RepID=A0A1B6D5A2_9HEMI